MPTPKSKGKGRATERTPLLDENDSNHASDSNNDFTQSAESSHVRVASHLSIRQVWQSYLLTTALVFLTLFLGLAIAIILLADSYASPALNNVSKALSHSGRDGDRFWKEAILVRGPDAVSITGVKRTEDENRDVQLEVNMTVVMRVAVDTDFIMGFREEGGQGDSWWKTKWKDLGRWSVRQLGITTAMVNEVLIYPSSLDSSQPLVGLKLLSSIFVPLYPGLTAGDHHNVLSSLEPLSIPLTIHPSQNASFLFDFFKDSWANGFVSVQIRGSDLKIYGGSDYVDRGQWWEPMQLRDWLQFYKNDFSIALTLPIPPFQIPSHPPSTPGSDLPKLSELLILESFNITSAPSLPNPPRHFPSPTQLKVVEGSKAEIENPQSPQQLPKTSNPQSELKYAPIQWNVLITAFASLLHPFGSLASKIDLTRGFPALPFVISLPIPPNDKANNTGKGQFHDAAIPVAEVYALPEFNTTHIRIPLSGYVLPLLNSSSYLPDAISAFISSYLSYQPSPISVSSPLYPSMEVTALFPPPNHRLELLRDVVIEDMSIYPGLYAASFPKSLSNPSEEHSEGLRPMEILASAIVHVRVVLPRGMDVDIRVVRLWVDCLVFDGEVPSQEEEEGTINMNSKRRPMLMPPTLPTPVSDAMSEPPLPDPQPLPTPLPPRAFGKITPRDWLNATSSSLPRVRSDFSPDKAHIFSSSSFARSDRGDEGSDEESGTNVYVTAQIEDVPLEVLPGRQGDLSRFVTKVLFSREPVMAGVRGVAAVGVTIPGLTGPSYQAEGPRVEGNELILNGLPFEGNVRVGGRSF